MDQVTRMARPAVAQDWMLEKQAPRVEKRFFSEHPDGVLVRLAEHCPAFAEDLDIQHEAGLPEEYWHQWTSLLVKSGQSDAALAFSRASTKHNEHSEERIVALKSESNRGTTRCATLGCDEAQISKCHGGHIRRNEEGEITNSPGKFAARPKPSSRQNKPSKQGQNLTEVGFSLDRNTGRPNRLNANIFSKHVVDTRLDLVYVQPGRFYLYTNGVWGLLDDNTLRRMLRDILHEFVPNFWTPAIEEQYMQALALDTPSVKQMDTKRQFINLENGMLDLRKFELVPHDKSFYSTIRIPIAYDPEAKCPTFRNFLRQVFEEDKERIKLVREMFGYCLTSEVSAQKAFILFGKGANGKSVLADVLETIIGPSNTCALTLNDLEKPFARSELVDKQLILSTENETDSRGINTQFLKAITSGDAIRVERKHEQGFMYRPFCKVVLGMNNLPNSRDKSYAFIRRLIIIPFNRTFDKDEADVHLTDKLKRELPGILNFALLGLNRLRKNGFIFTQSEASQQALRAYEEELNPIALFVEEAIEKGAAEDRVSNDKLAKIYRIWCQRNGHSHPLSNQRLISAVRSALQAKGIKAEPGKSGGVRHCSGIRLKVTVTNDGPNDFTVVDDIESME